MGDLLTTIIAIAYVVISIVYAFEGNWNKSVYFFSAAVLTGAVARM